MLSQWNILVTKIDYTWEQCRCKQDGVWVKQEMFINFFHLHNAVHNWNVLCHEFLHHTLICVYLFIYKSTFLGILYYKI